MAEKKQLVDISTEDLVSMLDRRKLLADYFRSGKDPDYWVNAVREVEAELRKRGALS